MLDRVAAHARIIGASCVVVAVAGGIAARREGVGLGARSAPLAWVNFHDFLGFGPEHPWWPLPVLVVVAVAAIGLLRATGLPSGLFLAGMYVVALAARLGLNTAQFGLDEWTRPLRRPDALRSEYPAAYDHVAGHVRSFIDHFAELVPHLPTHPAGHPVGATLLFYAIDQATGGPTGTALVLSAVGTAAIIPTFLLGAMLFDGRSARLAVVLFALAPQTLIYGTTSYDAAFVPLAAMTVWLLLRRPVPWGALLAAAGMLVSYALALAPAFAVLVAGRREGRQIAVAAAVATGGVLAFLAVAFGYDPLHAVVATHDAYERGIGGQRPYTYWVIGAPAALLIVLGPLLAERLLRGVELGGAAARAVVVCILLAALSSVIEAEGERILQFLTPLAAVAAAPYARSRRWIVAGIALGLLEAYLIELHWDTTF
jgi:hypothetical protein